MVFMVLTRAGFDEVFPRLVKGGDALWVNAGLLTGNELELLRSDGWNLTVWARPLTDLTPEIDMVRLHHADDIVWVATTAGLH